MYWCFALTRCRSMRRCRILPGQPGQPQRIAHRGWVHLVDAQIDCQHTRRAAAANRPSWKRFSLRAPPSTRPTRCLGGRGRGGCSGVFWGSLTTGGSGTVYYGSAISRQYSPVGPSCYLAEGYRSVQGGPGTTLQYSHGGPGTTRQYSHHYSAVQSLWAQVLLGSTVTGGARYYSAVQ